MWKQTSKKTKRKEPCCVLGRSSAAGCKWRWWGLMRGTFRLKVTRSCRSPWHSLVKEKTASQGRLLLQCKPETTAMWASFLASSCTFSLFLSFHFPCLPSSWLPFSFPSPPSSLLSSPLLSFHLFSLSSLLLPLPSSLPFRDWGWTKSLVHRKSSTI